VPLSGQRRIDPYQTRAEGTMSKSPIQRSTIVYDTRTSDRSVCSVRSTTHTTCMRHALWSCVPRPRRAALQVARGSTAVCIFCWNRCRMLLVSIPTTVESGRGRPPQAEPSALPVGGAGAPSERTGAAKTARGRCRVKTAAERECRPSEATHRSLLPLTRREAQGYKAPHCTSHEAT